MYPDSYIPHRLVKYFRGELTAKEHLGFVVGTGFEFGETFDYPFYIRSCAKPLQASLIIDENLDFTSEEIALCCGSHAGEDCHIEIAKKLLNKLGLKEENLKCGIHKPISESVQIKLIKNDEEPTVFHNNCVGKHLMMLALCQKNNWDIDTYNELEHPVQELIKEKIYDLCEIEEDYPITKDGCGVPIHSMPLKNLLKGYLNTFTAIKYAPLKDAFRNHPYIIGGENRLDTKIIQNSENLIAKLGADGLCVIINTEEADGFIVKILDCDMEAREITALSMIKKLNWAKIPINSDIKTLHGEVIGLKKFVGI